MQKPQSTVSGHSTGHARTGRPAACCGGSGSGRQWLNRVARHGQLLCRGPRDLPLLSKLPSVARKAPVQVSEGGMAAQGVRSPALLPGIAVQIALDEGASAAGTLPAHRRLPPLPLSPTERITPASPNPLPCAHSSAPCRWRSCLMIC